MNELRRIS